MILTSEFLIRCYLNKPFRYCEDTATRLSFKIDSKTIQMIFGVCFSSLCMFIRYFHVSPGPRHRQTADSIIQRRISYHRIDRWLEWQCHFERVALRSVNLVLRRYMVDESPTVGFDGFMIVLALAVLNVFHPSRLLIEDTDVTSLGSIADIDLFGIGKAY